MPIHRKFTASCDKCDAEFTGESDSSSHLKELMKKAGWKCANTYVCPECRDCCAHCGNPKQNKTVVMAQLDASQTLTVAESEGIRFERTDDGWATTTKTRPAVGTFLGGGIIKEV